MQQPCVFPPGYRFLPTNEELVGFFLLKKVCGESFKYDSRVLHECDIYKNEPWNLWEHFGGPTLNSGEDLYFFTELKKVTETASRNVSRKAASGTWKGDTSETKVYDSTSSKKERLLGSWKTFHYQVQKKDIPKDQLSCSWNMREYKLADSLVPESRRVHDLVLCRLRRRDRKDNKRQASAMEEMDVREVDIPESSNNVKVPRVVKDDSSDVMCAVDQNEAPQNNYIADLSNIADTAPVYYVQPNPDAIISQQSYYTYDQDLNDGLISHQLQPSYLDYYDERLCIDTTFLDEDVILDESSDDPSNFLEIQQPLQMQGPPDQAHQGIVHDTVQGVSSTNEQSEPQNYDIGFPTGLNDSSNVIQQQQMQGPDQFQGSFASSSSNNVVGFAGKLPYFQIWDDDELDAYVDFSLWNS